VLQLKTIVLQQREEERGEREHDPEHDICGEVDEVTVTRTIASSRISVTAI
jgi:hypothetical protein